MLYVLGLVSVTLVVVALYEAETEVTPVFSNMGLFGGPCGCAAKPNLHAIFRHIQSSRPGRSTLDSWWSHRWHPPWQQSVGDLELDANLREEGTRKFRTF